jgi:hypothetical protein
MKLERPPRALRASGQARGVAALRLRGLIHACPIVIKTGASQRSAAAMLAPLRRA